MLVMDDSESDKIGLNTAEALHRLYHSLKVQLNQSEYSRTLSTSLHTWIRDAYHHNSQHSPFSWTSAAIILTEIFALLLFHAYGNESFRLKSMAAEIFFLFLFLFLNICVVGWDNMLRHIEMQSKAKTLLLQVDECKKKQQWDTGQYSNLHTPQSPCISTQWTYRDNQLVNLPCHLLVEGDVILLRPGHASPGKCQSVDKQFDTPIILTSGKVFAPVEERLSGDFSSPQLRKPAKPAKFILLETPYIKNFKLALQQSLKRPITLFNRERHTVLSCYMERIMIPAVLVVTLCVGALHAAYFSPETSEVIEHLLLHPALAIVPLLPLALPLYWIVLLAYGMARLLAIVELSKKEMLCVNIFEDMEELSPPTVAESVKFEDLKSYFLALLFGKKGYLWRSANLLQVLGSITALCCVDKKGILSWPNPTAEKIFFLKPSRSKTNSQDNTYLYESSEDMLETTNSDEIDVAAELKKLAKINKRADIKDHIYHPCSQVEVLDLTHNVNRPFGIQFDDPNWQSYIGNLKPLGLAILLNTCNPKSQHHYTQFSDHIACESLYNSAAVPVVNKRCLCELAKQIGFTSSVVDFYELQQELRLFRHVHPEVVQKGRLARSLNFPRLKMPFPNISCAVVKDLHRGSQQLFSQGTADLILDACNEYWDGEDICTLTDSDRKRILDFYHRSSLTAHCMSYAYSPMNVSVTAKFPEAYIELPPDGSDLFPPLRSVAKSIRSWDTQNVVTGSRNHFHNRCLSSDSLSMPDQGNGLVAMSSKKNYCLEQLGNEIFIGMVTMQYQACPDFVQLIEQLDKGCIRFVHFSKENELRSRVFSEKMGLESGWNCHISLLNEPKRPDPIDIENPGGSSQLCMRKMSAFHPGPFPSADAVPTRCKSAPSFVNLDMSVIRFEDEMSAHSKSDASLLPPHMFTEKQSSSSEIALSMTDCDAKFSHESASSIQNALLEENFHHSPSHITESTDQSAPVTFDMSNRAKLPKGTENIRPHIENVDNVPLQVSLFTECTAEATKEMICIMQEYGEVVCCLGSSANCQNIPIFLQADVSIAIEPLHPQLCMQHPVFTSLAQSCMGPMDISCALNSLPCVFHFRREDPISFFHLIMEARHFMSKMRNSLQFMLCCCLSLSLLQIMAVVFFVPFALPLAHLLWFTCLIIPLLSLSLMGNPVDSEVTTVATGKNLKVISKQTVVFFVACYCAKFCPSVIVTLFCFVCMVANMCSQHSTDAFESCWIFVKVGTQSKNLDTRMSWAAGLTIAQNVISFFALLYFILISMGFIHRSHLLWNGNPLSNKYWVFTTPVVILLQVIFIISDISIHSQDSSTTLNFITNIPFYVWLLGFFWPLLLVPINELVKWHEIKMNVRQQKKARLEFCTKLGMNSPF